MPTSPKTAKDIVNGLEKCEGMYHCTHETLEDHYVLTGEEIDLIMRAAIEAVQPDGMSMKAANKTGSEAGWGYTTGWNEAVQECFERTRRFFNDDPTSPPTPRN